MEKKIPNLILNLVSKHKLIFALIVFLASLNANSQCGQFTNSTACTSNAPTIIGNSVSCITPSNDGGRRNFVINNMIAGATYRIDNCNSNGQDTQITIYNGLGGNVVAYIDDNGPACSGLPASIDFTPTTTGTYYIQTNKYYCATSPNTSNGTINVTYLVAPVVCPAIISNPVNSTIVTGGNTSFTVGASNNPTSYLWQVSSDGGNTWSTVTNGGVYSNATSATLNITNANSLMNGYRYRASATNSCGTSSFSTAAILTVTLNYCTPTTSTTTSGLYINRVAFIGTLNDPSPNISTHATSAPLGYQNFTGLTNKAIQAQGEGINISASATGITLSRGTWKAWVDWNKNGVFEASTEEVYNIQGFASADATFGFVIPPTTTPGDYRIRIRVNNGITSSFFGGNSETFGYNFTPCDNFGSSGSWFSSTANYGEAEDYLFTVIPSCDANIISVFGGENCGSGNITLSVTGTTTATGFKWYANKNDTVPVATTTNGNWTTPSLTSTTTYWVTATSAVCESVYKTPIVATVNPTPTINFTPSDPIICGDNTIIDLQASGDKETVYLINENFESGNLGVFSNTNNDSNNATVKGITSWKNQTSTLVPDTNVWFPAISSGFGSNKFALAYSDSKSPNFPSNTIENSLSLTNSINTSDFLSLTLKLKLYYSRYYPDGFVSGGNDEFVNIELSTDGGTTYPIILESFINDIGIGTKFADLSYDLSPYINVTNLKIRIRHRSFAGSGWLPDGVATDDVELYGEKPLNTSFNYNTSVVDAYQDLACTIPYTPGTPITQIFIKPTVSQLENAIFNIPVTTILSNGCEANGSVTVTNNTKLYTPSAFDTDWNTPTNWRPIGVPTDSNCIVVYEDVIITGPNNVEKGLNLIVKSGKKLNIAPGNSLVITDFVNVENNGTFEIENNSSLVQINDVTNTGNIIYKRTAENIKGSDYVYWSSPVNNQALNTIYTSPAQGPKYKWDTLLNNGNGTNGNISQGNWVNANGNIMATGTGYIVRGSSNFGMAPTNINSTFIGIPNNGTIPVTIHRGSYIGNGYIGANGSPINRLDDNNNLIGNPYPSAINALQFINDNSVNIEGNVKLWTHGTDPGANNGTTITNPFYGTFSNNYSASDYVTINFTGTTIPTASELIKAGQAFFVDMIDGVAGSGTVIFNNNQRRDNSGNPYANDNFFRISNEEQAINIENFERHRIWLDIKDANNSSEITLVGYVQGATMDKDSKYDALSTPLTLNIYSIIDTEKFSIQGRSLPFDDDDQVAIGFNVPASGNYTLGINTADGLFLGNQDIYLKDELLDIYHDLKSAPYAFTSTSGVHNDRFKLVYKNTLLSNVTFNENEIQIAKNNNTIEIVSGNEIMSNVKVYDIRGRLIVEKNKINDNKVSIDTNNVQDQVLIVNIVTAEGIKVTKKIL